MSSSRRRQLIERRLRAAPVEGQGEVIEMLREHGVDATQATVSRDLAAIGAMKGPNGYTLAETASSAGGGEGLEATVRDHVLSATPSHSIVVVRTAPGHADLVAVAFDRWPPKGVGGCIAGDDTVFLATTSPVRARAITGVIRGFL